MNSVLSDPGPAPRATVTVGSDPASIADAAAVLRAGGLVAFPTETVYGLGADATDGEAVAGIFAAKGRPRFNPLIAHVPDAAAAAGLVEMPALARQLAEAFWPGPLTLVLPKAAGCPVSDLATAGLATLAVRVPDHPVARALLSAVGRPLAAPSANRSGHVSPTTAAHVAADLAGRIDRIVDGGPTAVGVESTILAVDGERLILLRPGGVTREAIEAATGRAPEALAGDPGAALLAPGMLASHYAPRARVRLGARDVRPGEALLAFGPDPVPGEDMAAAVINLSVEGDLRAAAARLFGALRDLDHTGAGGIAVAPLPDEGLGAAINDRLVRAAAPR